MQKGIRQRELLAEKGGKGASAEKLKDGREVQAGTQISVWERT